MPKTDFLNDWSSFSNCYLKNNHLHYFRRSLNQKLVAIKSDLFFMLCVAILPTKPRWGRSCVHQNWFCFNTTGFFSINLSIDNLSHSLHFTGYNNCISIDWKYRTLQMSMVRFGSNSLVSKVTEWYLSVRVSMGSFLYVGRQSINFLQNKLEH